MTVKLKGLSAAECEALFPDGLILAGYRGSIAHETYVPPSDPTSIDDKDLMGVFVPPLRHYIGFGVRETHGAVCREWDVVSYELRKYVRLLLKANPNVLGLLWVDDNYLVHVTPWGETLRGARDMFATRRAYHSFTGYAHSQLARMTRLERHGRMGAKRKALVERFGYDTKNASHLIRLLRMGVEFLVEGELHVAREDARELLAIKRGEWTLEQVKAEAGRLFKLAEEAYLRSPLPPKPDVEKAERLVMDMLADYHNVCEKDNRIFVL